MTSVFIVPILNLTTCVTVAMATRIYSLVAFSYWPPCFALEKYI